MLERLERARLLPENQDPVKQIAIKRAKNLLSAAGVVDPQDDVLLAVREANKKSEFIFDHPFFTYYPERGRTVFIKKDKRTVRLNYGQNSVLEPMARNPDKVTTHEEFAQIPGLSDALLKKNIQRLRYKLGDERAGKEFRMIKSVIGDGYILSTVDEQQENQFPSNNKDETDISGSEVTVYRKEKEIYVHSSGLKYNPERYSVTIDGEEIFLSYRQKRTFDLFVENQNQVISTQRLWEEIYADDKETLMQEPQPYLIHKHVGNLRKKIKDKKIEGENNFTPHPECPDRKVVGAGFTIIQTVHGRGYMLVEPGSLQLSPAA